MPGTRQVVVGAAIVRGGRLLACRRTAPVQVAGRWELPGGKVEPGEAPEAALRREIAEELAVDVEVGRIWDVMFHAYPDYDVYMLVYRCGILGDAAPRPVEVADLAWVAPDRLGEYRILPADAPLVTRLRDEK